MRVEPDHPQREVLIVEDDRRMGQMLGDAMVELGYRATVVTTGEEALRHMTEQARPIVIMDLNLPGMSGMECLAQIRSDWPETAAIVLTGFGDLDAAKRAIHLDVVEFLTKPAHLGELDQALSRAEQKLHERDMKQLRQRIAAKHPDAVDDDEAAAEPAAAEGDEDRPPTLRELERRAILDALARHDGVREKTADELGISVRTLYYRLKEYQEQGEM